MVEMTAFLPVEPNALILVFSVCQSEKPNGA
jgi:hypothetical protein